MLLLCWLLIGLWCTCSYRYASRACNHSSEYLGLQKMLFILIIWHLFKKSFIFWAFLFWNYENTVSGACQEYSYNCMKTCMDAKVQWLHKSNDLYFIGTSAKVHVWLLNKNPSLYTHYTITSVMAWLSKVWYCWKSQYLWCCFLSMVYYLEIIVYS